MPIFKKRGQIEPIKILETIDEKVKQSGVEKIRKMQKSQYSRKSINEFVDTLLGNRKKVSVGEIAISSEEDFIRIIYVAVYASNLLSVYRIENIGDYISAVDGYEFRTFDIVRR